MTSDRSPLQDDVVFLRSLPMWLKVLVAVTITLALAAVIYVACDMVHWYLNLPASPD